MLSEEKRIKLINTNTITRHNDIAIYLVIDSRGDQVSASFKHFFIKVDDVTI